MSQLQPRQSRQWQCKRCARAAAVRPQCLACMLRKDQQPGMRSPLRSESRSSPRRPQCGAPLGDGQDDSTPARVRASPVTPTAGFVVSSSRTHLLHSCDPFSPPIKPTRDVSLLRADRMLRALKTMTVLPSTSWIAREGDGFPRHLHRTHPGGAATLLSHRDQHHLARLKVFCHVPRSWVGYMHSV